MHDKRQALRREPAYTGTVLHRLASLGRPPRSVVWMLLGALAVLVVSIGVLHGTPPAREHLAGHRGGTVLVDRTGAIDIVRIALDAAAVVLALYALVRWSNAREDVPGEDEAQRHYGDSIVDARTSVDPAIGIRPVNSEPPRR